MSKKIQKTNTTKLEKKINNHYLNISNEEFLIRTLRLIGVTQSQFLKETKTSLQSEIFPKNVINPTSSKQFFYIVITCLKYLTTQQQFCQIKIWYPPRNLNQQLQFKKVIFKILQNLQIQGKVPKNLILTKGVLMGDTSSASVIQFLRFLSQLALRQLYLDKHSKRDSLIQVGVISMDYSNDSTKQNDINRFYIFPFVPTKTTSEPPKVNVQNIRRIFSKHIKNYKRKLISLRTSQNQQLVDPKQIMSKVIQQKQLSQTLSSKVPKQIISQNRAFDRRRIIDKNNQIWKELNTIKCHFSSVDSVPIIKIDGQVDKILDKWQTKTGIAKIYQSNSIKNHFEQIKKQAKAKIQKIQQFNQSIADKLEKYLIKQQIYSIKDNTKKKTKHTN